MKGPGRFVDLTGQRFSYWLVVARAGAVKTSNGSKALWLCRCECGTEKVITTTALRTKNTVSCGCKRGSHHHLVNYKVSPTYSSWRSMMCRCLQPSNPAFAHYQKRGISICDRWRAFENFLTDMGKRPINTTLDRIDNNGNYEPGNARWATKRQQANNRITNVILTYQGTNYTLIELSRHTGVSKELLRSRLVRHKNKNGRVWTIDDAISEPKQRGKRYDTPG